MYYDIDIYSVLWHKYERLCPMIVAILILWHKHLFIFFYDCIFSFCLWIVWINVHLRNILLYTIFLWLQYKVTYYTNINLPSLHHISLCSALNSIKVKILAVKINGLYKIYKFLKCQNYVYFKCLIFFKATRSENREWIKGRWISYIGMYVYISMHTYTKLIYIF